MKKSTTDNINIRHPVYTIILTYSFYWQAWHQRYCSSQIN